MNPLTPPGTSCRASPQPSFQSHREKFLGATFQPGPAELILALEPAYEAGKLSPVNRLSSDQRNRLFMIGLSEYLTFMSLWGS